MEQQRNNGSLNLDVKKINFPLGLIGAIIGVLLGGVIWFAIAKLGYIAGLAGFLIVFLSIEGFKRLGKGIDTKALIICIILSFIMIFLAQWTYYVVDTKEVYSEWGITLTFQETNDLIIEVLKDNSEIRTDFIKDLAIGYGLSILCSFSYIKNLKKETKDGDTLEQNREAGLSDITHNETDLNYSEELYNSDSSFHAEVSASAEDEV